MEYIILKEESRDDLQERVNHHLNNNWMPQGGVSTYFDDTRVDYTTSSGGLTKFKPKVKFIQAMIRSTEKIF